MLSLAKEVFMAEKIIIFSGKQYSGKDTAGKIFLEELKGFKRCAMGDIIKLEYGRINGLSYEEIEANKSEYRAGLIELGNWGRSQSPDYWLEKIISQEGKIIVTDVRVPHEYEVFKSAGAISIRVEASRKVRASRGTLVGEDDITEVGLDDITNWDYVIENNTDYESFKAKLMDIINELK